MRYLCLFEYPMDSSVRPELHADLLSVVLARQQYVNIRRLIVAFPVDGEVVIPTFNPDGLETMVVEKLN